MGDLPWKRSWMVNGSVQNLDQRRLRPKKFVMAFGLIARQKSNL